MSRFEPTAAQRRAIELRGSSVLVSAAAGSGKTRVVTERVLASILDPEDPASIQEFLIITFTKAAATELKSRIGHAVQEAMREHPGDRRLKEQHLLCPQASIGTIHSFCQNILRENSHALGIAPDFRVLDEDRAAMMKQSAMDRVMESRYEKMAEYEGFEELVNTVGTGRDDSRLVELAMDVYEKMQCHADPASWAREQKEQYLTASGRDPGETVWGQELLRQAEEFASAWVALWDETLLEMARDYGEAYAKCGPSLEDLRDRLKEFLQGTRAGWQAAAQAADIEVQRMTVGKAISCEFMDRVKELRTTCKGKLQKITEPFLRDSHQLTEEIRCMAPAMCALMDLVMDFSEEYQGAKHRASVLDFSDLEHYAVKLLEDENGMPSPIAEALTERYREIMIDEYQDVSEVQEHIFNAVSRDGNNLFMVGDVKQSIYRFRLADPQIFLRKYHEYVPCETAEENEPKRILLQENFRSRREIIGAVNQTFRTCMSPSVGEILYDEDAALHFGADYYEGEVPLPELTVLDSGDMEEDDAPDKVRREAQAVAELIRSLMSRGTRVENDTRPLEFGDIAILLRSANAIGKTYQEVLEENGIPANAGSGGTFFRTMEVSTILSLLKVIDNPHQDIPLIAVLNSPMFGVTPDELTHLRSQQEEGEGCYEAVVRASEEIPACGRFLRLLEKYRLLAPDIGLSTLLWMIYDDLNAIATYGAMIGGESRRENLLLLLDYTRKFEETGYYGVHRFIQWLKSQEERGTVPAGAAQEGSAVLITSIHKSKGLEYPVVILSDTGRMFNKSDSREPVLVHPKLGLGPKVVDREQRIAYPTMARLAIRNRLEQETISEEMRLLYVALTRAKERLFITGTTTNAERFAEEKRILARRPMNPELIEKASSPLQWMMYTCLADDGEHFRWQILHDVGTQNESQEEEQVQENGDVDEQWMAALHANLNYRYPHERDTQIPSKITATELKRRLAGPEPEPQLEEKKLIAQNRSDFESFHDYLRRKEKGSTRRGTLTHLVLQHLDLDTAESEADIRRQMDHMQEQGLISEEEKKLVKLPSILRFLQSEMGTRIKNSASGLRREYTFSVLVPSIELLPEEGSGETILLQGAIDCWFEEDGNVILVDYKTDRIEEGSLEEHVDRYRPQMKAYAIALREMIRKPVSQAYLCFLDAGQTVEVSLDEA